MKDQTTKDQEGAHEAAPKWEQVGHPRVRGRCPSCGAESLFLGSNGYVTCAVIGCKDPGAPTDLLVLGQDANLQNIQALRERAERLLADLTALRASLQWQPIATAPKDGTPILACQNEHVPFVARWTPVPFGGYFRGDGDADGVHPTHFMPLPSAPIAKDSAVQVFAGKPVLPGVENINERTELQQLRASLQQVVEEMRAITELGSVANRTLVRQWIAALSPLPVDGQETKAKV